MTQTKRHTLILDSNKKVTMSGITAVNSIFEKEIEVETDSNKLIIKGSGLKPSVLNVEEGTLTIEGEAVFSVVYGTKGKKINFAGLFK